MYALEIEVGLSNSMRDRLDHAGATMEGTIYAALKAIRIRLFQAGSQYCIMDVCLYDLLFLLQDADNLFPKQPKEK